MKATEKQYKAFIAVRDSGLTNMYDVAKVIELASTYHNTKITRDQCLDIIHNFNDYEEKYGTISQNS